LGSSDFIGIAVPARSQGLELAERSGIPLVEQAAGPRHPERQQGAGQAKINEIQSVGPKPRSNHQIQGIEVGRAVAPQREVDVAFSARVRWPPIRKGPAG
jgi:hypothetical protein